MRMPPPPAALLQELINDGELFDKIISMGSFSEAKARGAFRQLCSAVAYLHGRGIVHRSEGGGGGQSHRSPGDGDAAAAPLGALCSSTRRPPSAPTARLPTTTTYFDCRDLKPENILLQAVAVALDRNGRELTKREVTALSKSPESAAAIGFHREKRYVVKVRARLGV